MRKACQLCLLSLAAVMLCQGCSGKGKEEKEENSLVTDTEELSSAISFEGQDMKGNAVSSEVFSESELTMVNVWATYCNPCLSEMPGLGELAKTYDPEQFQIIGIISDVQEGADQETMDFASGLIEQTGADYAHLLLKILL